MTEEIWTPEDEAAAAAEGWALVDGFSMTDPKYQVIALIGKNFKNDEQAVNYVKYTASKLHNKVRRLLGHPEVPLVSPDNESLKAHESVPLEVDNQQATLFYKGFTNPEVLQNISSALDGIQDANYGAAYYLQNENDFTSKSLTQASEFFIGKLAFKATWIEKSLEALEDAPSRFNKSVVGSAIVDALVDLMTLASIHEIRLGNMFAKHLQTICDAYADQEMTHTAETWRVPSPPKVRLT